MHNAAANASISFARGKSVQKMCEAALDVSITRRYNELGEID
jgi:hypothetical protein